MLKQQNNSKSKIPFAGPGTVAMLLCLILLMGFQSLHPPKVKVIRKVEPSGEAPEARLPTVSELLDWKAIVGLTEKQVEGIRHLQDQQIKTLTPIEIQLSEITSQVQSASKSSSDRALNPANLQMIAKQLAEPSRQKREIEKRFSQEAWTFLADKQKETALALWHSRRNITTIPKEDGKQ
ncbi:MAG: hypothetical protein IPG59_04555 [Candidatus Melainabacteria bacterium]|nr:MAG: hypothetical protein IPG59_04555 [Candidatus Melainabacteria bacterium]